MAMRSWIGKDSTPARREALWAYLFIAAPIIGFLIFGAMPIIGSLFVSMTEWDLYTSPEWVGFENWSRNLSLNVAYLPQNVDVETGELLFRCGREKVVESKVPEYAGQTDTRGRPIICEPDLARASTVLPEGFTAWFTIPLFGREYVVGARDPVFWQSLFNTVVLLMGVPISLAISLALALAMNQKILGTHFFRTVYYIPTILPIAALALVWLWIFNPDFGLLNYLLRSFGLTDLGKTNWLQDVNTVKPALIIMTVWRGLGYQMIIYVAGLQGISRQLYEAAEIDGAGAWAKFRYVTWPGLTPTAFFLLITGLIGAFQIFQEPAIMTNGGPYFASTTTVMLIWQNAFRDLQMGYAATQAWVLGVIIMALTVFNFFFARRWVFYETT